MFLARMFSGLSVLVTFVNQPFNPPHLEVSPTIVPVALGVNPGQLARWYSYRDDQRS